jgi:DNA-binding NtrC family response regulator
MLLRQNESGQRIKRSTAAQVEMPFIAGAPVMRNLLDMLKRVAHSHATVLVEGDSGTGKEVCARWIHAHSMRSKERFIGVNCAALPDSLLESELFGHERGAFTGATVQRLGRFEQADGGTIFLDEIGAASPAVQLRLLRVLQEREFERVGGTQPIRVDVRVVAATNVDLQTEVNEGRFREDLLYRLRVVPVKLPPLRERKSDISLLIAHFIQLCNVRNGRSVLGMREDALRLLSEYPWPGNVRQLANVVEQMVVLTENDYLSSGDVPTELADWRSKEDLLELGTADFKKARALFERRFLCEALERHNGVIAQVAEAIGMSRKNLYLKLDSLGIEYDNYRRCG